MFWKKVVILISFLFTAKRTLMMSSSHSRSGSRSRSRARSRGPTRRRSPRSRSLSGSEGECDGGSGQDNSFPPLGDVPVNEAPAGAAPARTVLGRGADLDLRILTRQAALNPMR